MKTERPTQPGRRQAGLHARIFRDVLLVVVLDEVVMQHREVKPQGGQAQGQTDQNSELKVINARIHLGTMMHKQRANSIANNQSARSKRDNTNLLPLLKGRILSLPGFGLIHLGSHAGTGIFGECRPADVSPIKLSMSFGTATAFSICVIKASLTAGGFMMETLAIFPPLALI